jgi:hypothetical protein
MGKRIKYFNETEQISIENGQMNYLNLFTPEHLPPEDPDSSLSKKELIKKYQMIESQRTRFLHNMEGPRAFIKFSMPYTIAEEL